MRGRSIAIFLCLVAMSASCGRPIPEATATPSPSKGTPAADPTTPARVDLVPTLTNPASHPPCGFWTRTEEVALQKLTYLGFAVAVAPTGSMDQVRIVYEIEGENQPHATTFRNGVISEGKSTRPTGTSATYLSTDVGFMPEAGAKFLARPSMITITVDPRKQVAESNEQNNVLRLRVTPANRGKISIADNACTVVE